MIPKDIALWAEVRADFLATGMSYKKLAEKHGVSISTLKKRAASEKWAEAKAEIDAKSFGTGGVTGTEPEPDDGSMVLVPTEAEIIDLKRERLERFHQATDAMMDRIIDALASEEVISPYSLKLLASALRDLREMQGLNKSDLDIEEQRARIAKLKSETRTVESPEDQGIVVEFVDTFGAEE